MTLIEHLFCVRHCSQLIMIHLIQPYDRDGMLPPPPPSSSNRQANRAYDSWLRVWWSWVTSDHSIPGCCKCFFILERVATWQLNPVLLMVNHKNVKEKAIFNSTLKVSACVTSPSRRTDKGEEVKSGCHQVMTKMGKNNVYERKRMRIETINPIYRNSLTEKTDMQRRIYKMIEWSHT